MNQSSMASRHTNWQPPSGRLHNNNNQLREIPHRAGPPLDGNDAQAPHSMRNNLYHFITNNAEAYESVAAGLVNLAPPPVRTMIRYTLNNLLDHHQILRDFRTTLEHLNGNLPYSIAFTLAMASALANAYLARQTVATQASASRAAAQAGRDDSASAGANVRPRMHGPRFGERPDIEEARYLIPQVSDAPGNQNHPADAAYHAPCSTPGVSSVNRFAAMYTIWRTSRYTPVITIGLLVLAGIALCILSVHHESGDPVMHPNLRPFPIQVSTTAGYPDSWYNP